ncbi:hypothetical protein Q7P37_010849 [Cladosporium fusiforme]
MATQQPSPRSPATARVREVNTPADLTIICGQRTFHVHKSVVCDVSSTLRDLCSSGDYGVENPIVEERYNAATMTRLLSFIYKGDYSTGAENDTASVHNDPKLVVLAHLSCHTIANSYHVARLGELALERASAALDTITPEDFTLVVNIVTESTDAESIHHVIRTAAIDRLDELIRCDSFVELLTGKRLPDVTTINDIETAKTAVKMTTKLATLSAIMLCMGRLIHNEEQHRMLEQYNEALSHIENLRGQAEMDKAALLKSKESHNDAFEAIQAAARRAMDAEGKLQEVRARFAQDEQKFRKATQATAVKAVIADVLAEAEKPRELSMRLPEQTLSHSMGAKLDSSTLTGRIQPSEKQLYQESPSDPPKKSELVEARAQIAILTAEKKALQESLKKVKIDKDGLSQTNAKLTADRQSTEGMLKKVQIANVGLSQTNAGLTADKQSIEGTLKKVQTANVGLLKVNAQLQSSNSSLFKSLNASHPAPLPLDQARRRQYIIRRLCHLGNKLDRCTKCRSEYCMKLIWDEQSFTGGTEPEVTLKCRHCGQNHTSAQYLDVN